MTELIVWILIAVLVTVWAGAGTWAFDVANRKGYPERARFAVILGPLALIPLLNLPDAVWCEAGKNHDWEETGRLTRRCKNCGLDRQLMQFRH